MSKSLIPGLHRYDSIEATGFDMGQIGSLVVNVGHLQLNNRKYMSFVGNWDTVSLNGKVPAKNWHPEGRHKHTNVLRYGPIGIFVLNEANVQARVRTFNGVKLGDDLAVNATYTDSTSASINYLSLTTGMYWGNFDQISLWKPASGNYVVKIIIGKWK